MQIISSFYNVTFCDGFSFGCDFQAMKCCCMPITEQIMWTISKLWNELTRPICFPSTFCVVVLNATPCEKMNPKIQTSVIWYLWMKINKWIWKLFRVDQPEKPRNVTADISPRSLFRRIKDIMSYHHFAITRPLLFLSSRHFCWLLSNKFEFCIHF